MSCILCVVGIDANQPFDAAHERGACLERWPHQSGYLIVTGGYTRALTWHQGVLTRKGGEAFPVAAPASLARLGLWLVQEMLQAVEHITPLTALSRQVFAHFNHDIACVIDWSKQATAEGYIVLAQAVLAHPQDPLSIRLLTRCAAELELIVNARPAACGSTVYLSGALAQACLPYLQPGTTV